MSALREYHETMRYLFRKEVSQERVELFKILNGDAFFPLKTWPDEMRMVFWHKPIRDKDTFKLTLLLLGNGCSPNLISNWILFSQCWVPHKQCGPKTEYLVLPRHRLQQTLVSLRPPEKMKWTSHIQREETPPPEKKQQKNLLHRREKKGSFRSHQMYKSL